MTQFEDDTGPIDQRLRDGLERLATALRTEAWRQGEQTGLTPLQQRILDLLQGHPTSGLRVTEIADALGIRQATASQSIQALMQKAYVAKVIDPADRRAARVLLTKAGSDQQSANADDASWEALTGLDATERVALLRLIIKMIHGLQLSGAIQPQRLCITCRHFRPNAHPGRDRPHHCALVDAAFGDVGLRLDCREHEAADAHQQRANWAAFAPPS